MKTKFKLTICLLLIVCMLLVGVTTAATSPNDVIRLWKENCALMDSNPYKISCTNTLIYIDPNKNQNQYVNASILDLTQQEDKFFAIVSTKRFASDEFVTLIINAN